MTGKCGESTSLISNPVALPTLTLARAVTHCAATQCFYQWAEIMRKNQRSAKPSGDYQLKLQKTAVAPTADVTPMDPKITRLHIALTQLVLRANTSRPTGQAHLDLLLTLFISMPGELARGGAEKRQVAPLIRPAAACRRTRAAPRPRNRHPQWQGPYQPPSRPPGHRPQALGRSWGPTRASATRQL